MHGVMEDAWGIHLDECGEIVLIQVEHKIMDKIELIANNNKR